MIEGWRQDQNRGEIGKDISPATLQNEFDAVVLSVGLARTPGLGIAGEEAVVDGLEFIEASKVAAAKLSVAAMSS